MKQHTSLVGLLVCLFAGNAALPAFQRSYNHQRPRATPRASRVEFEHEPEQGGLHGSESRFELGRQLSTYDGTDDDLPGVVNRTHAPLGLTYAPDCIPSQVFESPLTGAHLRLPGRSPPQLV